MHATYGYFITVVFGDCGLGEHEDKLDHAHGAVCGGCAEQTMAAVWSPEQDLSSGLSMLLYAFAYAFAVFFI